MWGLNSYFIDFAGAFDSVNREYVGRLRRDIPEKIMTIIRATYDGTKCHVLH